MAEAVVGLLAAPLVDKVKKKLRSAIEEQASLLWNFDDDLGDMMNVLETISAALEDAERRSVKEKVVQLWLKRLKDVSLDISDVLEDYQDTRDQATAMVRGFTLLYTKKYPSRLISHDSINLKFNMHTSIINIVMLYTKNIVMFMMRNKYY